MNEIKYRPPGYINKEESAAVLGVSTKTFDRRRKTEPLLAESLRIGNQLWFLEKLIYAYFEYGVKRGSL